MTKKTNSSSVPLRWTGPPLHSQMEGLGLKVVYAHEEDPEGAKYMGYHPPTPYTLSPLPKGGEGRGEGGSYTHVPCSFGVLLVTLYYFLAQTFFLGGTSPQRTCSVGRGRSKCPSYHPPTPYTLSPLRKGGEGRGEGGSYTHVPCPFGALLVTLCYFLAQTFFLGGTSPQRTCSVRRGRSKCSSYHPPTPSTLSPLRKGGEGRDEGGSYTHMPCPFGALLVALY